MIKEVPKKTKEYAQDYVSIIILSFMAVGLFIVEIVGGEKPVSKKNNGKKHLRIF
jgi:hypothetical protein